MASYTSVTKYVEDLEASMPTTGSSWTVYANWSVHQRNKTSPVGGENGWNQCEIVWYTDLTSVNASTGYKLASGGRTIISRETLTWEDAVLRGSYYWFHSECAPPEGAETVWCVVTIQASDGRTNKSGTASYPYLLTMKNDTSNYVYRYQWDEFNPPTPSGPPSVTINAEGTKATLLYTNIPSVVEYVSYHIIRAQDGDMTKTYITYDSTSVNKTARTATITVTLNEGDKYAFCAAFGSDYGTGSNKQTAWSEYCEYSDWYKTKPDERTLVDVRVTTVKEDEVLIKWKSDKCALDGILVQYAQSIAELETESGGTFHEQEFDVETPLKTLKQTRLADLETGVVWYFRVKGFVDADSAKYYTGWYYQATTYYTPGKDYWAFRVPLGTVPDAPTTWTLQQTYAAEADTSAGFTVYAIHNSEDGSPCSYFKIHAQLYNADGSLNRTLLNDVEIENDKDEYGEYVTSNLEYKILPYNLYHDPYVFDQKEIRWKIKTKGAVDEYGPYSQTRVMKMYRKPTATISASFGGSSSNMKYPLELEASLNSTSQNPLSYYFEIVSESQYQYTDALGANVMVLPGTVLYSSMVSPEYSTESYRRITIAPNDAHFERNCSYTASVTIYTDGGLSASSSMTFTYHRSSSSLMYPEIISVESDDDRSLYLMCRCYSDAGQEDYYTDTEVTMALYRYNSDGTYTLVSDNVGDAKWIRDPHPRLDHQIYRVTATMNDTGESEYTEPDYAYDMFDRKGVVIHWDEKWGRTTFGTRNGPVIYSYLGQRLFLPFNVDVSESRTVDKTLIGYIGREDPVVYYGTSLGKEYSIKTEIPKKNVPEFDSDTVMLQLRKLSILKDSVYIRTSTGIGCWATVDIDYNIDHCAMTIPITIKVTPVEGGA